MAIKRYYAEADNTITNAYDTSLSARGTGSNAGANDILETFFLNLFHGGKLSSMPPKLINDEGDLLVLRPCLLYTSDAADE